MGSSKSTDRPIFNPTERPRTEDPINTRNSPTYATHIPTTTIHTPTTTIHTPTTTIHTSNATTHTIAATAPCLRDQDSVSSLNESNDNSFPRQTVDSSPCTFASTNIQTSEGSNSQFTQNGIFCEVKSSQYSCLLCCIALKNKAEAESHIYSYLHQANLEILKPGLYKHGRILTTILIDRNMYVNPNHMVCRVCIVDELFTPTEALNHVMTDEHTRAELQTHMSRRNHKKINIVLSKDGSGHCYCYLCKLLLADILVAFQHAQQHTGDVDGIVENRGDLQYKCLTCNMFLENSFRVRAHLASLKHVMKTSKQLIKQFKRFPLNDRNNRECNKNKANSEGRLEEVEAARSEASHSSCDANQGDDTVPVGLLINLSTDNTVQHDGMMQQEATATKVKAFKQRNPRKQKHSELFNSTIDHVLPHPIDGVPEHELTMFSDNLIQPVGEAFQCTLCSEIMNRSMALDHMFSFGHQDNLAKYRSVLENQ